MIEQLESRTMLAAAAELRGDHLSVHGKDRDDVIRLEMKGKLLIARVGADYRAKFQSRDVKSIQIAGGAGDDFISIKGVTHAALIIGGDGADTLVGGDGDDSLEGREGNDRLSGRGGDDDLNGGNGRDVVRGGAGDDLIRHAQKRDSIHPGAGLDTIDRKKPAIISVTTTPVGVPHSWQETATTHLWTFDPPNLYMPNTIPPSTNVNRSSPPLDNWGAYQVGRYRGGRGSLVIGSVSSAGDLLSDSYGFELKPEEIVSEAEERPMREPREGYRPIKKRDAAGF